MIRRTQIANICIKYFFSIIVSIVLGERENLCKKGSASNNTQEAKSKFLFQVFLRIIAVSKVLAKREKTSVRKDLQAIGGWSRTALLELRYKRNLMREICSDMKITNLKSWKNRKGPLTA